MYFLEGHAPANYWALLQTLKQQTPSLTRMPVFIFPGNSSHHTAKTTLYSVKSGAKLASAARDIGDKGYPTLSLPTTSLEDYTQNPATRELASNAIGDLYRALGAGYTLALPVRKHKNTTYFTAPLNNASSQEPSFWGGMQTTANPDLAAFYLSELNRLIAFEALSEDDKQKSNNPHWQAYVDGQQKHTTDPWFAPPPQKSATPKRSPERANTPSKRKETLPELHPTTKNRLLTTTPPSEPTTSTPRTIALPSISFRLFLLFASCLAAAVVLTAMGMMPLLIGLAAIGACVAAASTFGFISARPLTASKPDETAPAVQETGSAKQMQKQRPKKALSPEQVSPLASPLHSSQSARPKGTSPTRKP